MSDLDAVLARIDADLDAALERLFAMLRHQVDLDRSGLCRRMPGQCRMARGGSRAASASTPSVATTPGHPMVVGA